MRVCVRVRICTHTHEDEYITTKVLDTRRNIEINIELNVELNKDSNIRHIS